MKALRLCAVLLFILSVFCVQPLEGAVNKASLLAMEVQAAAAASSGHEKVAGKYEARSGSNVGVVSVYPLKNGNLSVRIDSTKPIPGGASDCHINFDAPLNGNTLEFRSSGAKECLIRIEFRPEGLDLTAGEACNDPVASQIQAGNCEKGATLINGRYTKTSDNPDSQ